MSLPPSSDASETNGARVFHDGREFRFVHSDPDDHLISLMRSSRAFYEAELLATLVPLVRAGATVIDVGANIGNHSVFFAGVMGCQVVALEPNPAAASILEENLALNGLSDRVRILRCAAGADRRKGQVTDGGAHNLGMAGVRADKAGDIEIVPIDELGIAGDVGLLKVDVEGAEYDVLSGAMTLLKAHKPVVVLEVALIQDYRRIAALLGPLGYVPVGSYNYTPTHVFRVPAKGERVTEQVADISHRLSMHYIDAMERTANVDRILSALRQQVGQQWEAGKAAVVRLDVAERDRAKEAEAVRKGLAEQQSSMAKQFSSLGDEVRAVAARLGTAEAVEKQQAVLVGALTGIMGQLESLGSLVTGLQGELAALRRDVAEQSSSQTETTLALIRSGQAAQDGRSDDIEARIGSLGEAVTGIRQGVRQEAGLMVEMQLIASTEAEARLDRLGTKIEMALRQALDERLSERLRHRFAELTGQLTEAIGTAIADRDLLDEIADPAGTFDLAKAMAVLGIAEPAQTEEPRAPAPAKRNVWFVNGHSDKAASSAEGVSLRGASSSSLPAPALPIQGGSLPKVEIAAEPLPPAVLVALDFRKGWEKRGWAQGETGLESGGFVRAHRPSARLGFVGPTIPCAGGGLIEVEIELGERSGAAEIFLRLQTETGFAIGHDFVLGEGVTTLRAFAPHRTKQLKFYVLMLDAPAGASFRVGALTMRRLDGESHRREVRARVGEPILASMATIPGRRDMLRDCVASLLLQCDRVRVFLNNYPDVPDFLAHPRVEVRRSQDWDDRGDAGKFFWIDKDRDEGGYRVIADDDLIFPPDFVEVMTGKVAAAGKRAIFSMHGILLRQPLARFHDRSSRAATFHFGYQLETDRGIHIGGTGVMCFHATSIDMKWHDFKYCNSGDLWIALYAQRHGLPMITPARRRNWIVENERSGPDATIYDQSLRRTRTRFDSSGVQDAVLRRAGPLTVKAGERAKIAVAIVAESAEGVRASVEHWLEVARLSAATTEFVVILAHDGADAAVPDMIAALQIPHETHLVDLTKRDGGLGLKLEDLRQRLGIEAMIALHEDVRAGALAGAGGSSPGTNGLTELNRRSGTGCLAIWSAADRDRPLAFALCADERAERGLSVFLGGTGLIAARTPRRAGFSAADLPPEAMRQPDARTAGGPQRAIRSKRLITANDVFERVVVMNLDRRPDRWQKVSEQLTRAGIAAERFSAVDGTSPAIAEEYAGYAAQPLHKVSPELPRIAYSRDLYMDYASQMARIAHIEAQSGRKAVASAGAWGYLRSYEAILERSLDNHDETLLVFDDDVVFHRDFKQLFADAVAQLPDDWLIVQLGTLQYNWAEPWARWRAPMLYQTNGAAIGSHAVGMRFDVLPFLLDHTKRMDMPYDIGALSAATRAFPDRCFVIYPNLAIQALDCSDIGTSGFQKGKTIADVAATHRWNLDDYALSLRMEGAGQ